MMMPKMATAKMGGGEEKGVCGASAGGGFAASISRDAAAI